MDLGLVGRRAAVAGASSGLGLASARALVEAGARVAICGRDPERVMAAAATLGERCVPVVCDVAGIEGGARFVELATEALGGVDIVVPNAGGPPPGTFASTDAAAYQGALELNLLSVVGMCKAAIPAMQQQHWGRVVAITSVAVRQPMPHLILSNTARAGVTGFLKTLALEVAAEGITVNTVQPGLHATSRITAVYGESGLSDALANTPAGRLGDPDEFGQVVAFLCSEQASFITGAHLPVDGGQYLGLQ